MNPVLELTNITLERQSRTILRNINWMIEPGQQWVVMGLNGSGKTSLLTIITGYQWPTFGKVSVLGRRYGTVDLREMRKHIGWVSQHLAEWMTRDHGHQQVKALVASGREAVIGNGRWPTDDDRLESVMQKFDLIRLARSPFSSLSQGATPRVLLARAWMADVSLLILDEPCSGLDIAGREHLLGFIQPYLDRQDAATPVIYVTHHPEEILPGFTHALLLKDGRVSAQGPVDEVLTDSRLSEAFGVPVRIQHIGGRRWVQILPLSPELSRHRSG